MAWWLSSVGNFQNYVVKNHNTTSDLCSCLDDKSRIWVFDLELI